MLSLNVTNTIYILFANKSLPNLDMIFINIKAITRVYETKFLGVIIQHNLKWHAHILALTDYGTNGLMDYLSRVTVRVRGPI